MPTLRPVPDDPGTELRDELAQRAAADWITPSEVIRQALRRYLHAA
jgi:hypothetical protein